MDTEKQKGTGKHLNDPLFKNAYFLMFSSLTSAGSGFFFWLIAARFYSTSDIGLASAIISAMGLIAMLSLLGFDISLVRFLPECSSVKALNDLDMKVDCVIVAVAHDEFKKMKLNDAPVLIDVRGIFDGEEAERGWGLSVFTILLTIIAYVRRNTIPEENRFVVEFVFAANNDLYKIEDYKYNR